MKANRKCRAPLRFKTVILITALTLIYTFPGLAQEPEINWILGPAKVDLGQNLANLSINENYVFADAKDTVRIMESIGNPPTNTEIGCILPSDNIQRWYIVFEHQETGYIKDDEKGNIDSDTIIKSLAKGTENTNKYRIEKGHPALHVKGWYNKPFYDENSHNLTWTVLLESSGSEIVNHNVRLLGRNGYISATLVTDPPTLDVLLTDLDNVISNIHYIKGKSYSEYVKGDKLAKYGLTALIAGGAATAAVKFGLFKFLAKFWKMALIMGIAAFSAIAKIIKSIFSRKKEVISEQF